jgi:hypothetical protein
MQPPIRKLSKAAEVIESHWSLGARIADHWPWIMAMIATSGLGGWFMWLIQVAASAPWYTKALFTMTAVLFLAFIVSGIWAFVTWMRRSRREEGAIATGLAWSGYTYGPGSVIDGGTHRLSEIFGIDQMRNNLLFRNCRIEGPGIVALIACHCEKSDFFDLPKAQFIDPRSAENATMSSYQFLKCRFEGCSFNKMIIIANIDVSGPDVVTYILTVRET